MVRQVRVIYNTAIMALLFAAVLWLARASLSRHLDAVLWGLAGGVAYGVVHWYRLERRIGRRDRRFERNKVLVRFLSPFELLLAAAVSSHYLLIGVALLLLALLLLGWLSGHWWTILLGSLGLGAAVFVGTRLIAFEVKNGPVYYQYDSRAWSGGEGMLYEQGSVVEPLAPIGRVVVNGELWNAVSVSGEPIDRGERIEVIARDGLTLRVDRIPAGQPERGER